jgi:hypothetical protein
LIILIVVLAAAWFVPWQTSALVRVVLATALFILPGAFLQQWLWPQKPDDLIWPITVGFAVSISITSLLGIAVKALHFNYVFVETGLFIVGAVSLIGLFLRQTPESTQQQAANGVVYGLIVVAVLAASFLIITQLGLNYSYKRGVFVDDFSYAAQTTQFRATGSYNFEEVMHGTGYTTALRNLFAMLPLSYAVIAESGGIATHEFFLVFRVVEILLFLLAGVGLARALKLSWSAAALAAAVQTVIIARFYRVDYISSLYPEFMQDKGIAAYVLAPILVRVAIRYAEIPNRRILALVGIVSLAMSFTHPTIYIITCGLIGLFMLIGLIRTRRWRPVFLLGIVLALGLLPHVPLRLIDEQHQFSLAATDKDLRKFHGPGTWNNRMGDFKIYDYDHNLYALQLNQFNNWVYKLFLASIVVSLFRWRHDRAAVYLLAAGLLWLSVTLPITAPLWGRVITPLHLRRVLWLLPTALGAAYLAQTGVKILGALIKPIGQHTAGIQLGISAILIGVAINLLPEDVSRTPLSTGRFAPFRYHQIVDLSQQWGELVDGPVVALGTKDYLNDVLPSLLPEINVIYFRNVRTMMRQNNIPLEEATKRSQAYKAVLRDSSVLPVVWQVITDYQVEYILADQTNTRLIQLLSTEKPDEFVLVLQTERYRLFRIIPPE